MLDIAVYQPQDLSKMRTCHICGYQYQGLTCPCTWGCQPDKFRYGINQLASIDDFSQDLLVDCFERLRKKRCIGFTGESGAGKTYLSYSISKYLYNYENFTYDVLYNSEVKSINDTQYKQRDILILDEFSGNVSYLDGINQRLDMGKITICTTNVPVDQIDKRYAWRIPWINISNSKTVEQMEQRTEEKKDIYNNWCNYWETSCKNPNFLDIKSIIDDEKTDDQSDD